MGLMELLDSKFKISLPTLNLKHMNHVFHQDKNGHFWHIVFVLLIFLKSLVFPFLYGNIKLQKMFLVEFITFLSLNPCTVQILSFKGPKLQADHAQETTNIRAKIVEFENLLRK